MLSGGAVVHLGAPKGSSPANTACGWSPGGYLHAQRGELSSVTLKKSYRSRGHSKGTNVA